MVSEVAVENGGLSALTLAPVAVDPPAQDEGIGSLLIRTGLEKAERRGYALVFLHGSTAFYPRFGFESAVDAGFENPFVLPDEHFMVCELAPETLDAGGTVTYPSAFDDL